MNENDYLQSLLVKQKLSDEAMEKIRKKREEVEQYLRSQYGSDISNIYYSWSIGKWTAIADDFDVDICVYFESYAFDSLKDMYLSVKKTLASKYNTRIQRVSIALTLHNIDIVPGRKVDENGYINLYDSKDGTWRQTNIRLHKTFISEKGDRDVIRLLKLWKTRQNIDIKSFALEILSIRVLQNSNAVGLANKLRAVWEYIRDRDITSLNLVDPANANNNLMDSIDEFEKFHFQNKAKEALSAGYWNDIIW